MRALKHAFVALAVVLGLLSAGTALASQPFHPQAGSYSGGTSQTGGSVSFKVSKSGTAVKGFTAEILTTCTKGSAVQEIHLHVNPTPDMQIHKRAFGFHSSFNIDNGTAVIANGKGALSGKFTSAKSASGSFEFPWTFDSRAGSLSGFHCDAGKVTFQTSTH